MNKNIIDEEHKCILKHNCKYSITCKICGCTWYKDTYVLNLKDINKKLKKEHSTMKRCLKLLNLRVFDGKY